MSARRRRENFRDPDPEAGGRGELPGRPKFRRKKSSIDPVHKALQINVIYKVSIGNSVTDGGAYGIELREPNGKHDGKVKGVRSQQPVSELPFDVFFAITQFFVTNISLLLSLLSGLQSR